jgi:hypothetical protein
MIASSYEKAGRRWGNSPLPNSMASIAQPAAFLALTASLQQIEWVVYSKPPFGGPQRVLEYLGRYTHRVALDNRRILNVHNGNVTFQYKQYRSADAHKSRTMTVAADEFIRRSCCTPCLRECRAFVITACSPAAPRNAIWRVAANCCSFRLRACSPRPRRFRPRYRSFGRSSANARPALRAAWSESPESPHFSRIPRESGHPIPAHLRSFPLR